MPETNHFASSRCLSDFISISVQLVLATFALVFSDPQLCLHSLDFPRMKNYQVNVFNYNIHKNNKTAFLDLKSKFLILLLFCFPEMMEPNI